MQTINFSDEYLRDKFSAAFLLRNIEKLEAGTTKLSGAERFMYETLYNLGVIGPCRA